MTIDNKASDFIKRNMDLKMLPRNQVAAISGLSGQYIQHLENGQIINVDRKKLIALGVALNFDLNQMDDMLTHFDRATLTESDIPSFIDPGTKRKFSMALLPLHAWFNYELIILIGERVPGHQVIVNNAPTANLFPEGYRTHQGLKISNPHPLYFQLVEAVGRARTKNFRQLLTKHQVEHYICIRCLYDYINNVGDSKIKAWRIKHIKMLISFIEEYENLKFGLTETCSKLNYTLKKPENNAQEKTKIFFLGNAIHSNPVGEVTQVHGFATENRAIVLNFLQDLETIKKSLCKDLASKNKLINHLNNLVKNR